ncbi:MAG: DUF2141 domain-containing protein [Flavobacteriaceae bacterium]|nr:DUF2141 domain-containing protein [Flavobacteriaceae bacterium]
MKTVLLALALAVSTYFSNAQEAERAHQGTSITINVPVQSSEGHVVYGLYNEANFMQQPLLGLTGEIEDGQSTVTFQDVAPGTYAVVLFHDKNKNNQMDFEPNGMPKEMYGVSNNVMSFGPPQWSEAKFEVADTPLVLEIRM